MTAQDDLSPGTRGRRRRERGSERNQLVGVGARHVVQRQVRGLVSDTATVADQPRHPVDPIQVQPVPSRYQRARPHRSHDFGAPGVVTDHHGRPTGDRLGLKHTVVDPYSGRVAGSTRVRVQDEEAGVDRGPRAGERLQRRSRLSLLQVGAVGQPQPAAEPMGVDRQDVDVPATGDLGLAVPSLVPAAGGEPSGAQRGHRSVGLSLRGVGRDQPHPVPDDPVRHVDGTHLADRLRDRVEPGRLELVHQGCRRSSILNRTRRRVRVRRCPARGNAEFDDPTGRRTDRPTGDLRQGDARLQPLRLTGLRRPGRPQRQVRNPTRAMPRDRRAGRCGNPSSTEREQDRTERS